MSGPLRGRPHHLHRVFMWVVSLGRSANGMSLAIGGILIFALPLMLPRYLGAVCLS
jgi:hypothetical protein